MIAAYFPDKVGVNVVVCVKDEISFVVVTSFAAQSGKEIIHCVSFSYQRLVETAVNIGAGHFRYPGGVIGAVVRDYIDIQKLTWIVLLFQALDQAADDISLIAGGNNHGIAVEPVLRGLLFPMLFYQTDHQVTDLIEVEKGQQYGNGSVKRFCQFNHTSGPLPKIRVSFLKNQSKIICK